MVKVVQAGRCLVIAAVVMGLTIVMGCKRKNYTSTSAPRVVEIQEIPASTTEPAPALDIAARSSSAASSEASADQRKTLQPVLLADVKKIIAQASDDHKILVIDFWATWCLPCVQMFPELHQKLPALSPRVRVVTVTLDSPGKYEARAVDFLRQNHALDNAYRIGGQDPQWEELVSGLGKQWHDLQVPAILVYNEQGELADEFINARAKPQLIVDRVKELVQALSR